MKSAPESTSGGHLFAAVLAIALLAACAARQPAATASASRAERAAAPGTELPSGPGRAILQASCTSCHNLTEVTKFRGYYDRAEWRDIVVTMVEYGAAVKPADVDVLAEYLDQSIGRR